MVFSSPKVNSSKNFELVFKNPSIEGVLKAIENQLNGISVLVHFTTRLKRHDVFQTTCTLPTKSINLFGLKQQRKHWEKLFQLAPHLAQPQKVIYLNFNKLTIDFTNHIYRFISDDRPEIIKTKVPENMSFLNQDQLNGIILKEYKFNTSRFFIELLKYFEIIGGSVTFNSETQSNQLQNIQSNTSSKTSYIIHLNTPSNFHMVVKQKKDVFQLSELNSKLKVEIWNQNSSLTGTVKELHKIISFRPDQIETIEETNFLTPKTITQVLNTIKKPLPCAIENMQVEDNYEMNLEKFDIAKQTGISFAEFKTLFHRYGAAIDKLTDYAYELMNEQRNPEKIWDETENWYQKQTEWK
ncbi:MAG: hypothetical protein R2757_13345 [Draconibacterium sp.]